MDINISKELISQLSITGIYTLLAFFIIESVKIKIKFNGLEKERDEIIIDLIESNENIIKIQDNEIKALKKAIKIQENIIKNDNILISIQDEMIKNNKKGDKDEN